jgi:hypothetical protein
MPISGMHRRGEAERAELFTLMEWLRPLFDRIEELSRENGRLEAERDQVRAELTAAREDAPTNATQAPQSDSSSAWRWEAIGDAPAPRRPWWRRLFRR